MNLWIYCNLLTYMVPGAGVEPARPIRARDFKSLASTNSATRASKLERVQNRIARITDYLKIDYLFTPEEGGSHAKAWSRSRL